MLQNTNDTKGDTAELGARRLPRGRTISREWELVGVTKANPSANPVRDRGAGGAGAKGSGVASWNRRLAPRHREAVRKFFTDRSPK